MLPVEVAGLTLLQEDSCFCCYFADEPDSLLKAFYNRVFLRKIKSLEVIKCRNIDDLTQRKLTQKSSSKEIRCDSVMLSVSASALPPEFRQSPEGGMCACTVWFVQGAKGKASVGRGEQVVPAHHLLQRRSGCPCRACSGGTREDGAQEAQVEGFVWAKHRSGEWKLMNARGEKPSEAKGEALFFFFFLMLKRTTQTSLVVE